MSWKLNIERFEDNRKVTYSTKKGIFTTQQSKELLLGSRELTEKQL
jgi:hypothetical protein